MVRVRLADRVLQSRGGERIFTANVDVAPGAARGERGDRHRLDDRKRIVLHQHPVLERSGLRLVGIADQVVRERGLSRNGVPLPAGWKGGAAAAHQLRGGDLLDDGVRPHRQRLLERGVAERRAVGVEADRIDAANATKEAKLIDRLPVHPGRAFELGGLGGREGPRQVRFDLLGGHRPEQPLARLLAGLLDERGGRAVAHADAGRPHPRGVVVFNRHPRVIGRVRVHRAGGFFDRGNQRIRAVRLAADVVADVHDTLRPRSRRQQGVERRDTPGVGGWHVQALAHVAETAFADPADARLDGLEGRQQQVAKRPGIVSADVGGVRVARRAAGTALP